MPAVPGCALRPPAGAVYQALQPGERLGAATHLHLATHAVAGWMPHARATGAAGRGGGGAAGAALAAAGVPSGL